MFHGSGFRVGVSDSGLGVRCFTVLGFVFRVSDSWFSGPGFQVRSFAGSTFRGSGFLDLGLQVRGWGFGVFEVPGFDSGFEVPGSGLHRSGFRIQCFEVWDFQVQCF